MSALRLEGRYDGAWTRPKNGETSWSTGKKQSEFKTYDWLAKFKIVY